MTAEGLPTRRMRPLVGHYKGGEPRKFVDPPGRFLKMYDRKYGPKIST
jgi:hypothetical protein